MHTDALIFNLVVLANLAILVYLQRRYRRRKHANNTMRGLQFVTRRETTPPPSLAVL